MYTMFYTSKTALSANQSKLDIISNNIANSDSTGYKKINMEYSDLVDEVLNRPSYPTNGNDISTGTGAKATAPMRNYEQGALAPTDSKSNLAIDGEGFFRVIRKDGTYAYTRNGGFNVDALGKIVDDNGNILDVQFDAGYNYNNTNIDSTNLTVSRNGELFVDNKKIGKINLYQPIGTQNFISEGDSLFVATDAAQIKQVEKVDIVQGYRERSNVSLQEEFVDLIATQRAFQMNSKGIKTADEMWQIANNLRAK
ncbi:TPA: flagellar basal body rod protein FlgG [Clostridioides difficile]|uniref:Flagellar basal body rod protein FlgG n=4 Tax=Clostridioides difficile TaxID=1496 RepID=Q18D04_CLOD6|nr:flagellar hook-basal body complex protein [Clostridioides difficile]EQF88795.1 flagellar hook-basal body family protein [Clostridioides difficile CD196]EQG64247.1 flagellar hook-basal body family protein [Clostridioides difficile DA00149]EQI49670.1 flagellar hook-basal body family protein [Clostridioides difficile Y184]EQK93724.1 flagellar hook-basal body family protein [Clostridioides difficile CD127]OFU11124.1 flagellar biosynthesis protein FlgG [Clostridium sp. HMSC19D02]OFU27278.1 flag